MTHKKANLFIVGAPRCGTTSMCLYLNAHPDVFIVPPKEILYFGTDLSYKKRPTSRKYESYFARWKDEKYGGEATTLYLYSQRAAEEIKEYNPSARIIILLRNPVDFLYSYHQRLVNLGFEDIEDFQSALEAESERQRGRRLPRLIRKRGPVPLLYYREVAKFSEQVQRYFDIFPKEQVQVTLLDDIRQDTARVWREMLKFLDVDPDFEPVLARNNANIKVRSRALIPIMELSSQLAAGRSLPARAFRKLVFQPLRRWNLQPVERAPMPDSLRRQLHHEFVPEVKQLEKLLERDLSRWTDISEKFNYAG